MIRKQPSSRRTFLKQLGMGLVATLIAPSSWFSRKLYAHNVEFKRFEEYLKELPQFTLGVPESIEDKFGVFKIPVSAMHKVGPLDMGVVVVIVRVKKKNRLKAIPVEIKKSGDSCVFVREKAPSNQPTSYLQPGHIILNDLKQSLIKLREIDVEETQQLFIH